MSLFLSVSKDVSTPTLFRVRGVATTVGLDERGVFCTERPAKPLLFFTRHLDKYYLRIETTGITVNGVKAFPGAQSEVRSAATVLYGDTRIAMHLTGARAEFGTDTSSKAGQVSQAPRVQLRTSIGGITCSAPFSERGATIGSAENSTLCLPFEGIMPLHAECLLRNGLVDIVAPLLAVSVAGVPVCGFLTHPLPVTLELMPLGVRVFIRSDLDYSAAHEVDARPGVV